MSHAPQLLNAFLLTVVLIILLRDLATRVGFLDLPDERKRHDGSVPLVGGLAMFPAYTIASISLDPNLQAPLSVLTGFAILVAIGALDDRFGLRAGARLTIQAAAASLMIFPAAHSANLLGGLSIGGEALPAIVTGPLALMFIVGLANAFNMMDGLDGLAGGVAACALFWLAITAMALGREDAIVPVLPLLFCVLGFLVFNLRHRWRPKASVFMGDAGSLLLGGAVAYFTLFVASGADGARVTSLAPLLWMSALPAVETLSLILRRLRAGASPMAGDRRHLHHLLVDAGMSPTRAASTLIAASAALGAIGCASSALGAPDVVLVSGLGLVAVAHALVVRKIPTLLQLRLGEAATPASLPITAPRVEA